MTPLSIAIIGCGAAFEFLHKDPLLAVIREGWARLSAAADPQEARRRLAEKWFPGVRTYASAGSLFAEGEKVDLTVIASPPKWHRPDAEAALAAGSHVLCEKPLAQDVEDAEAIAQAARDAGRVLALGMTRRFYPAVEELRRKIAALPAGVPIRFVFRQGGVYGWAAASDAPFRRDVGGGGVLLDMGVHLTDILGLIFGWGRAVAAQDDALVGGVEANAVVDVALQRAAGRLHLSWDTNLDSALTVHAGEDEFWMPVGQIDVLYHRKKGAAWQPVPMTASWPMNLDAGHPRMGAPRSHNECMKFQLIAALRSILHGEKPAASGEDGVAALRIIHGAYQMAQPLDQPWLSPEEQSERQRNHWRAHLAQPALESALH